MSKKILKGKESREKLMVGIDTLADLVVSTLGPNGRNIVISKGFEEPQSTKDGVTVAKEIELEDNTENLGARLVKQAAIKTHEKVGDGTTTSTLLAREMIKNGLKHLNNQENAVDISRDITKSVKEVIKIIQKEISEDVSEEDQLEQIATISSNGDKEIGGLISEAIKKVGLDGVVYIEESKTGDSYLDNVEGLQFDRGYCSPYFVTDNDTMKAVLNDPLILLIDGSLTKIKQLLPVLDKVATEQKSLLIVANDITGEALATLVLNKQRGVLTVCAVKAPDFADRRKLILEDMAIITGGTVFSKEKGMSLDRFDINWFGKAKTVTIQKEQTTIIDGDGDEEKIEKRILELQSQIELPTATPFEIEKLQERLAKFKGGVSVINVGGITETEMKEKKDRVDDALNATRAAIEEGIIPGGGIALWNARESLTRNSIGSEIVYDACGQPFKQILKNAGISDAQAEIIGKWKLQENFNKWNGYNLKTGKIVNMKKAGIIDPTKVARVALENAAAVASIVLLTEGTIVDLPGQKKHNPLDGVDLAQFGM